MLIWFVLAAAPATAVVTQTPSTRPPDAFFVPTRQNVADAMLRLARVTADDLVYDLGSGDGRIVILAAQKYGARAVGVEIDPALVRRAREAASDAGVTALVRFIEGDLFTTDVSEATVVTLYLSTLTNRRLVPKLAQELRPGARIVSQQFDFGEVWPPDASTRRDGVELFLWRVPARRPARGRAP